MNRSKAARPYARGAGRALLASKCLPLGLLAAMITLIGCNRSAPDGNTTSTNPIAQVAAALLPGPSIPASFGDVCLYPTDHFTSQVDETGTGTAVNHHNVCDRGNDVAGSIARYGSAPGVTITGTEVQGSAVIVHSIIRNAVTQVDHRVDFAIDIKTLPSTGERHAIIGEVDLDGYVAHGDDEFAIVDRLDPHPLPDGVDDGTLFTSAAAQQAYQARIAESLAPPRDAANSQ